MMRALLGLVLGMLLASPSWAETRLPSDCIALARAEARVVPVGLDLSPSQVRIRFLQHASFAIESRGLLAVTDYTDAIALAGIVPDLVTMNIGHDTHYSGNPDPRIPLVLKGWIGPVDVDLDEMRIRNVTTDLRGPFGEGAKKDGNSIFVFEAGGLCIGHLSHLHQVLEPEDIAALGRLDVVMVPVDGAFTMDVAAMADVVRSLNPRIVLPMHWFSEEGLAKFLVELQGDYEIVVAEGPDIIVSRDDLPEQVVVLRPALGEGSE